jgi:F-type H+-transporting ATPase subunit a
MARVDPDPWRTARKFPAILRGLFLIGFLLLWAGKGVAQESPEQGKNGHGDGKANKKTPSSPPQKAAKQEKPDPLKHVIDDKHGHWEIFEQYHIVIHLPKIFGLQITKFMVMELIAALLILAIYIPLARRVASGEPPRGWWDNTFEVLLTFVRNDIAKTAMGEHDADRFVPFLWTLFLFILFNNLLGMLPFGGSPTASIWVTGALALCVFFAIHGSATAKMGVLKYLQSYWPDIEVPFFMGIIIKPLIFVLELNGALIRNLVLAVRLFANMFAGHMVLATLLTFIASAALAEVGAALWSTITLGSILGNIALSLLEIFVAFLQTYIFVFLAAIFIGLAIHPAH